jgi:hypothetical protein
MCYEAAVMDRCSWAVCRFCHMPVDADLSHEETCLRKIRDAFVTSHELLAKRMEEMLAGYYAIMAERIYVDTVKAAAAQVTLHQAWSTHLGAFTKVAAESKAEIEKEEVAAAAELWAMCKVMRAAQAKLRRSARRPREDPAECGRLRGEQVMAEFRTLTGMTQPASAPASGARRGARRATFADDAAAPQAPAVFTAVGHQVMMSMPSQPSVAVDFVAEGEGDEEDGAATAAYNADGTPIVVEHVYDDEDDAAEEPASASQCAEHVAGSYDDMPPVDGSMLRFSDSRAYAPFVSLDGGRHARPAAWCFGPRATTAICRASCCWSLGRGGDDVAVDGDVERNPGPSSNSPHAGPAPRAVPSLIDDDDDDDIPRARPVADPMESSTTSQSSAASDRVVVTPLSQRSGVFEDFAPAVAIVPHAAPAALPMSVDAPRTGANVARWVASRIAQYGCRCNKKPGSGRHNAGCTASTTAWMRMLAAPRALDGQVRVPTVQHPRTPFRPTRSAPDAPFLPAGRAFTAMDVFRRAPGAPVLPGAGAAAALDAIAAAVHPDAADGAMPALLALAGGPAAAGADAAAPDPAAVPVGVGGAFHAATDAAAAVTLLSAVVGLRVQLLDALPRSVARPVGAALAALCEAAAARNDDLAWSRLLVFPKLVLRRPSTPGAVAAVIEERIRRFSAGDLGSLLHEAARDADALATARATTGADPSFPIEDDFGGRVVSRALSTDATAETVGLRTLRRADRLVRQRRLSKAAAALSAAKVAPVDDATTEAMQAKHPRGPVVPPPPPRMAVAVRLTPKAVTKALRGFQAGTAPGPSGLSVQHLADCVALPGSPLIEPLRALCQTMLVQRAPAGVQPTLFGARLVALVKKDGGLRPIACGEILRRLAGKVLCSVCKPALAKTLLPVGQVGVGVRAGIEGLYFAARQAGERVGRDFACLKLDLVNAFNEVSREAVLAAVAADCPDALPYATSACCEHSWLFFGDRRILSAQGVQQGDPMGPAFFSLALATLWRRLPDAIAERLDVRGFYLDDGFLAGPPDALRAALDFLLAEGPPVGLRLNLAKSEFIGTADVAAAMFADTTHTDPSNWELLGAPCGSAAARDAWLDRLAGRIEAKVQVMARLPTTHTAFALVRDCGAAQLSGFVARMLGPHPVLERLDVATRAALSHAFFGPGSVFGDVEWAQLTTPLRHGGCGIRVSARHAAIAHVACFAFAGDVARSVCRLPEVAAPLPTADDGVIVVPATPPSPLELPQSVQDCQACPFVAEYPSVQELFLRFATTGKLDKNALPEALRRTTAQHALSRLLEEARAEKHGAVMAAVSREAAARVSSVTAKHSGAWLYGVAGIAEPTAWMSDAEFDVALRYRLGMPTAPADAVCGLCRAVPAGINGEHVLCCKNGGLRTLMHHAVARQIHAMASEALLNAVLEPTLPLAGTARVRADIAVDHIVGQGTTTFLDVAVTCPTQPSSVAAAAATPGGAAAQYADLHKEPKYAAAMATLNAGRPTDRYAFRALVVDTFGAWDPRALEVLRRIAAAWGRRAAARRTSAMQVLMHRVSFAVARGVARVLLASGAPDLPRLDRDPTGPWAGGADLVY